MPKELPSDAIEMAEAAIVFAQSVRRHHRRRSERGSLQRTQDIELAILRLKEAMHPLRSVIGKFPYGPQTAAAEANRQQIREISASLQCERRKLWKMRSR